MPIHYLPINNLYLRHIGLTKAVADCFLEAAIVCLDKHHISPQVFSIINDGAQMDVIAKWISSNAQTKAAWANEIDAIEWGAYGFAIAALEVSENLFTIHRAETKTGADYYVAPAGHSYDDLEDALRLEVSGTACDELVILESRLNNKVKQTQKGQSNLPAIAAVVGFRLKMIKIKKVY